jgi:hypothetical protein
LDYFQNNDCAIQAYSIPTRPYFHPNIVNTTVTIEEMLTPQLLELPHGTAEIRTGEMRNEFVKTVIKRCRFRDHEFDPYLILVTHSN